MSDRFKVNAESYAAFVEAFRAAGAGTSAFTPNFRAVAAAMGTTEHTAKRAWLSGFPSLSKNYGPIEDRFPRVEPIVPEVVGTRVSAIGAKSHGAVGAIGAKSHGSDVGGAESNGSGANSHSAAEAGAPSASAPNAHSVGAQLHTPTHPYPPVPTPTTPAPAAVQLAPADLSGALDRLVGKAPAVLVREWEALEVSRNNAIGVNILMGKVIERLMTEVPRLLQLDSVELTLANFTQVVQDVAKVTTLLTAAQGKLMESQRLLMNMPTTITEHRTRPTGPAEESPELEAKRARLGPLVALLSQAPSSAYVGEEGGADIVDAGGAAIGNTGRFTGSTGPGGGVREADKPQPMDPLLAIK